MRKLSVLVALMLAAVSAPAMAMTSGQASCPIRLAPAGLAAFAADTVMDFDEGAVLDPKLEGELDQLTKNCIAREHVAADKQDDYVRYVMSALISKEIKRRLEARGISTKVIDDAFEIGPGRRNPKSADLDEAAFEQAMRKMKAGGLDVAELSDQSVKELSSYVVSAADMYRLAGSL